MGIVGPTTPPAGSVGTEQLAANAVTAEKIAANAVTEPKIANTNVSAEKMGGNSPIPAKPAEKAVTAGVASTCKMLPFTFTGDGVLTSVTCKHSYNTQMVFVHVMEMAAEIPTKSLAITSWEAVNANETKINLAAAPGAGVEIILYIGRF